VKVHQENRLNQAGFKGVRLGAPENGYRPAAGRPHRRNGAGVHTFDPKIVADSSSRMSMESMFGSLNLLVSDHFIKRQIRVSFSQINEEFSRVKQSRRQSRPDLFPDSKWV
jgi:hypothetical protein